MRSVGMLGLAMVVACSTPAPTPDAPSSPWSRGPVIPVKRLEPGVTALGQRLVVLGGFDTDQQAGLDVTTRVDVLDTFEPDPTRAWSTLPDAPVKRHHVQIASIGTTLYLLGGLDATQDVNNDFPARGDCYALDTGDATPVWKPIAAIPIGFERGSAAVVVTPPRIYLFGGAATTAAVASNIYYDSVADAWCPGTACTAATQLPDLPQPRSHPAAMRRVDGTFAVVGGLSGLSSDTQASDVYLLPAAQQSSTGAWSMGVPMPQARGGCAYGVLQGKLICAGGEAGTSALSYTQGYDPLLDMWTDFATMPEPRAGTLGAAIGQKLYVPGGASHIAFDPTDSVFIFSPL